MIKEIEISVPPELLSNKDFLYSETVKKLNLDSSEVKAVIPIRRSIDARSSKPFFKTIARVFINEPAQQIYPKINYEPAKSKEQVIIVGSGPAGLFAALRLIEQGQARDSQEARQREAAFKQAQNNQQSLLNQARAERTRQEAVSTNLEQQFEKNQQSIITARQYLNK